METSLHTLFRSKGVPFLLLLSAASLSQANSLVDLSVGAVTGANIGLDAGTPLVWNFGVTPQGADAGFTLNTLRVQIKGDGKAASSSDVVTLQIYSGLGATAGATLLGTVTIPFSSLKTNSSAYYAYDLPIVLASTGLVGNLNLAAGGYSIKMTTGYTKGYSFKSGTASVVDGTTGTALTNNQVWFGDLNTTGTAGTSLLASAASPVLASAGFSSKTVNFGNYRVGDTKNQTLTLSNAALFSSDGTFNADGSPKLTTQSLKINSVNVTGGNLSYGTYTTQSYVGGVAVTSTSPGSFAPLTNLLNAPLTAAALNNSANINITLDTGTAGTKSGNAVFTLQSVQGNSIATGTTNLSNETVSFSGTGYRAAVASLSSTNAALGNFRVGDSGSTNINVSNTAVSGDAYSEKLLVSGSSLTGNATVGTLPAGLINAGASSSVSVGLSSITAGTNASTVTLKLKSDGTGTSGLSQLNLADQTVNVSATGYRAAVASLSSTNAALGNFRVGSTANSIINITNTAVSGDAFSEKLLVSGSSLTGNATVGTLPSLINAGASSSVSVGLSSITAGANASTVTLKLKSDGTGTSGLSQLNLADQTVNVSATGYRAAVASLSSTNAALGNFRVGDSGSTNINVSNTAVSGDAYSEKLLVSGSSLTGNATVGTLPSLINAGASSSVSVGLSSITAGTNASTVTLKLKSDGTGTSGLSQLNLADQTVSVSATGYRAATYSVSDIDLGNFHVGASSIIGSISIYNTATNDAYSEKLGVTTKSSSGLTAGSNPSLIAAGGSGSLGVTFSTVAKVGANTASVIMGMTSDGLNTSGLSALTLADTTVNVTATGYSGQATWVQSTGGTWNSFSNWDSEGGKPGVDGALSVDDQAIFGKSATGDTDVTLDGSNPVLTKITFNNEGSSYTIGKGKGDGSITLGASKNAATVTNTAGSHTISADVSLAHDAEFSVNADSVLTLSGGLNGAGAITKTGSGTLYISGKGDLTGGTTVSSGRLGVNGSIAGSSVLVESGAILSGSGTVGSTTIASGATIAPGNSPGNLTVEGDLTWEAGGNFNWDIYDATGVRGSGWDAITVTGNLNLSGLSPSDTFNINFNSLSGLAPDFHGDAQNFADHLSYRWNVITAGSITNFEVRNFTLNTITYNEQSGFSNFFGRGSFSIEQFGDGLDIVYSPNLVIPEPSTYGLGLGALALAAVMIRRRKRKI